MPLHAYILGTLAFAVLGAALYAWGYRRSQKIPHELQRQMRQLMEQRILTFLTTCPQGATIKTLANQVRGTRVGGQFQGYKLAVADHLAAAEAVVKRMVSTGMLRAVTEGKVTKYFFVLKEQEDTGV